MSQTPRPGPDPSRRAFLKSSAALSAAAFAAPLASRSVFAAGSDTIRVGLIGCGGRGSGAAANCVASASGVKLVAMADLFRDRLDDARKRLPGELGEGFAVTDEHCYTGFNSYRELIANAEVDLVILATPPGFRPIHLDEAIRAGKNVFMEKPVAVDPAGVRSVIESSKQAKEKKLAIVTGTQRRHQGSYVETIRKIHDGAIGEVVGGQCYWNQGGLWHHERQAHYSDMEWQIRNWLYFTWLSGDHIVEQHIHNIDVMNWVIGATPIKAMGMGGRQVRTDPAYGHIFDHFTVEYMYPGDVRVMSMCRQTPGAASRVAEKIVGTRGTSNPNGSIAGETKFRYRSDGSYHDNPYVQEHTDLIASIRDGRPLNEGQRTAESTLTAIMGRMSAYTGKSVTWKQALNSQLDLVPKAFEFTQMPVPEVAMPGKTPLV